MVEGNMDRFPSSLSPASSSENEGVPKPTTSATPSLIPTIATRPTTRTTTISSVSPTAGTSTISYSQRDKVVTAHNIDTPTNSNGYPHPSFHSRGSISFCNPFSTSSVLPKSTSTSTSTPPPPFHTSNPLGGPSNTSNSAPTPPTRTCASHIHPNPHPPSQSCSQPQPCNCTYNPLISNPLSHSRLRLPTEHALAMLHYSKPRPPPPPPPPHHTSGYTPGYTPGYTSDHTPGSTSDHTPGSTSDHTQGSTDHTPDYAHHTPGYTPGPRRSFDSSRYSPKIHSLPVELLSYIFLLSTHASASGGSTSTYTSYLDSSSNSSSSSSSNSSSWSSPSSSWSPSSWSSSSSSSSSASASSQQKTPPFTTESIRTPIIISSVDKHWRRVALTTPALWTNICVTVEMIGSGGGFGANSTSASAGANSSSATASNSNRNKNRNRNRNSASAESESHLDTRHLTSFLKLSKSYPLNILIDARDQDWDFSEPEITSSDDEDRLPSPPSPPPFSSSSSSSSSHTHPPSNSYPTYIPPFSPSHITTTLLLLLPHINRWRSLDILTDTYLPMHYALRLIHPELMRKGAEKLESLTLMRCNDFVSYGDEFEPRGLRGLGVGVGTGEEGRFLQLPEGDDEEEGEVEVEDHNNNNSSSSDNTTTTTHLPPSQILPRLHHLTLRGIHIHWNSLSKILNSRICGCGGLKSLELSSHCMDVRPTKEEMRGILEGCKGGLGELVLVGSGVRREGEGEDMEEEDGEEDGEGEWEQFYDDDGSIYPQHQQQESMSMSASVSSTTHQRTKKLKKGLPPVYLPNLKSFTLGYRSTRSGKELLEMVDAPGVERFTLEDASHPSDPEDIDAGKVLRYIGLGGLGGGGTSDRISSSSFIRSSTSFGLQDIRSSTSFGPQGGLERVLPWVEEDLEEDNRNQLYRDFGLAQSMLMGPSTSTSAFASTSTFTLPSTASTPTTTATTTLAPPLRRPSDFFGGWSWPGDAHPHVRTRVYEQRERAGSTASTSTSTSTSTATSTSTYSSSSSSSTGPRSSVVSTTSTIGTCSPPSSPWIGASSSSLSSSIPTSTSTSSASPSTSTSSSSSIFPNLTHFTIRHVKACPTPFHILFRSLTELKSIEIVGCASIPVELGTGGIGGSGGVMQPLRVLLTPRRSSSNATTSSAPREGRGRTMTNPPPAAAAEAEAYHCPKLERVLVKGLETLDGFDVPGVMKALVKRVRAFDYYDDGNGNGVGDFGSDNDRKPERRLNEIVVVLEDDPNLPPVCCCVVDSGVGVGVGRGNGKVGMVLVNHGADSHFDDDDDDEEEEGGEGDVDVDMEEEEDVDGWYPPPSDSTLVADSELQSESDSRLSEAAKGKRKAVDLDLEGYDYGLEVNIEDVDSELEGGSSPMHGPVSPSSPGTPLRGPVSPSSPGPTQSLGSSLSPGSGSGSTSCSRRNSRVRVRDRERTSEYWGLDPFRVGGEFNDEEFDAYYGGRYFGGSGVGVGV